MPQEEGPRPPEGRALLVARFVEAVNRCDPAALDALLDAGYRMPGGGGRERLKEALARYHRAVADARWEVQEQVAEGETVMTRFLARGTHRGALLGLAPTGREMAVAGVLLSRCRGERLAEQWVLLDLLGLLQQLGIMPELPLDQIAAVARVQQANERCTGSRDPER